MTAPRAAGPDELRLGSRLSPGEWAILGLVSEGPTHGFALAHLMAPEGELGRVWSIPRPVVYQGIKKLQQLGLIAARSTERSDRGPARTLVTATPLGMTTVRRWLYEPVEHVRDVRSLLLLKLALLDRSGLDKMPLLEAQRRRVEALLRTLEARASGAEGFEAVLASWRVESCRAVVRFLQAAAVRRLARSRV